MENSRPPRRNNPLRGLLYGLLGGLAAGFVITLLYLAFR